MNPNQLPIRLRLTPQQQQTATSAANTAQNPNSRLHENTRQGAQPPTAYPNLLDRLALSPSIFPRFPEAQGIASVASLPHIPSRAYHGASMNLLEQQGRDIDVSLPQFPGRAYHGASTNLLEQQGRDIDALLRCQLQRQSQLSALDARELLLQGTVTTPSTQSLGPNLLALHPPTDTANSHMREILAAMMATEASLSSIRQSRCLPPSNVLVTGAIADTTIRSMTARPRQAGSLKQTDDAGTRINRADLAESKQEEDMRDMSMWDAADKTFFGSSARDPSLAAARAEISIDRNVKFSKENFPLKLYRILYETQESGLSNIISFLPHGRAFMIHDPHRFVSEVMPRYFVACRLNSFLKNLGLYSFQRITLGDDKGAYFHQYFIRGKRDWCSRILRKKTRIPKAVILQRERERLSKQDQVGEGDGDDEDRRVD